MAFQTWFKLADNVLRHDKVVLAMDRGGSDVFVMWVGLLCYSNQHLTDGRIEKHVIHLVDGPKSNAKRSKSIKILTEVGLIRVLDDGALLIHNHEKWGRQSNKVQREREAARLRKQKERERKGVTGHGVTDTVTDGVTGGDVTPGVTCPVTGAEKRREEKKREDTPQPPQGDLGFDSSVDGSESAKADGKPAKASKLNPADDPKVRQAFNLWAELWRKHYKRQPKFSPSRIKIIAARFADGFSLDDFRVVFEAAGRSPHHIGENDSKTKYLDLQNLIRNSDKFERWLDKKPAANVSRISPAYGLPPTQDSGTNQWSDELDESEAP